MKEWVERIPGKVLAGIILLGAGLRLYHLNYQSLWYDELHTIIPTDPSNSLSSIIDYARYDQPPLFFIYIHYVFKAFGYNELVGRLGSAFIGLLGILSIYFLGKECQGKAIGLFASLLAAISYYHIYYSQELRFYSLCFLLSVLSYLFFIRAFKGNKAVDYVGYVIFTTGLLYTHYYGLIIFCTQTLTFFFLLIYKRDLKFIIASIISGIVILASYIPWIPVLLRESGIKEFWIKRPGPFFVAVYLYDYTGKDAFTMFIFIIFIFLFIRSWKTNTLLNMENKAIYLIIILWIVFSYLLPYVWSITNTPLLHDRYTIVTLPAWFLIFAIGWNTIKNTRWKWSLPALLTLGMMVNMAFFKQHYTRLHKDQFREASEIVISRNQAGYPVLSGLPWHFNFYFRNIPDKVKDLNAFDLSRVESFWLLQAHYSPDEMEAEIRKLSETFDVVENHPQYGANALLMKRR